MPNLTISEAAKIVGKGRSTLYRLMCSGKLSYSLDANGQKTIDPAELSRVFPNSVPNGAPWDTVGTPQDTFPEASQQSPTVPLAVLEMLQTELTAAREREEWLRGQIAELQIQNAELRQRCLPPATEDSGKPETNPPAQQKRGFWARLFS